MTRGSASPPMTGDSRTVPISALWDFRDAETDRATNLRPPRLSPFAALVGFFLRVFGENPRGDRVLPCIHSLGASHPHCGKLASSHPRRLRNRPRRRHLDRLLVSKTFRLLFLGEGWVRIGRNRRVPSHDKNPKYQGKGLETTLQGFRPRDSSDSSDGDK